MGPATFGSSANFMNLSEFDFHLPAELIAQRPPAERDGARMLELGRLSGHWVDRQFRDLPELLRGDELVVLNNARVLPARLFGRREGIHATLPGKGDPERTQHLSSEIEVLFVRPLGAERWEVLVKPGRKVPVGERIAFGDGELEAEVEDRGEFGLRVLRFQATRNFHEAVARLGHIPLPPYIKRADDASDRERYQTVFARDGAAVAAPTAGLHFTPEILERVRARSVEIAEVTLDVGLGTFEPVRTERLEDHKIHAETYEIPESTVEAIGRAKALGPADTRSWYDGGSNAGRCGGKSAGRPATLCSLEGQRRRSFSIPVNPSASWINAHEFSPATIEPARPGRDDRGPREHSSRVSTRGRFELPFLQLWRLYVDPIAARHRNPDSKALEPSDYVHSGLWFVYNLPFADEGF